MTEKYAHHDLTDLKADAENLTLAPVATVTRSKMGPNN